MSNPLHRLDYPLIADGFRQLVPLSLFVVVFGMAFGLAAAQQGLEDTTIILMSALVFAGVSQFAALELWGEQIPLLTLLVTVFTINSRHLLMGATLYPWLSKLPVSQRYGIMTVASDASWAMSIQAFSCNKPGLGLLFGGGLSLWVFWLLGSWLGIYFGHAISDPYSLGMDMVLACFLMAMVTTGEKSRHTFLIWSVAAGCSLLAYRLLPDNMHVVVGALAGGLAAILFGKAPDDH